MRRRCIGLAAVTLAVAASAAPAAAAGPAAVTVRVEGDGGTLIPRTALTTTTATVNKDGQAGHDCTGTSAAGALELASAGSWTGAWSNGLGYSVASVKGEAHAFGSGEYWGFFVNDQLAASGV